jgi:hypothetical protein
MTCADTPDDRLTILARAQETLERTLRLHTDVLASHADAHREHRERLAQPTDNHQVLLALLAASEQRLEQQRQMLATHAEPMARLDVLMQAIKELLERGQNGH